MSLQSSDHVGPPFNPICGIGLAHNRIFVVAVFMRVAGKVFPMASWCVVFGWVAFFAPIVRAVESGSTYYTSDPGFAPWNYVGSIGGTSGVYLGDYNGTSWVLTAAHVGAGGFTLGSTLYPAIGGSAFTIHNHDGSLADLTLFQISGAPGLANLTIVSSAPSIGTTVQMIGFGGGKSWGTNTIFGYADYMLNDTVFGGPGIVTLASGESGLGGQGVGGDSGGGLFYESFGTWYLAGVLSGAGDIPGFGNGTIAVDLAAYASQINADINSVSAIPEQSAYGILFGLGALGFAAYRRRHGHAA